VTQASSNIVKLTFQGNAGQIFRFEVSNDLATWAPLTNTGPNSAIPGEVIVMDKSSPEQPRRFYRASSQ
jgi:hypothetical protein